MFYTKNAYFFGITPKILEKKQKEFRFLLTNLIFYCKVCHME